MWVRLSKDHLKDKPRHGRYRILAGDWHDSNTYEFQSTLKINSNFFFHIFFGGLPWTKKAVTKLKFELLKNFLFRSFEHFILE